MNESSPHSQNSTSPAAAVFLTFAFLLMLIGVGYTAIKMLSKEKTTGVPRTTTNTEQPAKPQTYQVDPKTGSLNPVENQPNGKPADDPARSPDVGPFELTERSGKKITNEDLLGEPWAVCFIFTNCQGQCLDIHSKMTYLRDELGDAPVKLVTITVDPDRDTPAALRNYADNVGADPDRWLFLTGEKDELYLVLKGYLRQFVQDAVGEQFQKGFEVMHTPDVLHIDAKGYIVKRYNGRSIKDMDKLRNALLAEAKEIADAKPAIAEKPPIPTKDQN